MVKELEAYGSGLTLRCILAFAWRDRTNQRKPLTWMFRIATPWPLVRKRTISTERPPVVDEILCRLLCIEGYRVVSATDPYGR
jgi:hypothetical protein